MAGPAAEHAAAEAAVEDAAADETTRREAGLDFFRLESGVAAAVAVDSLLVAGGVCWWLWLL